MIQEGTRRIVFSHVCYVLRLYWWFRYEYPGTKFKMQLCHCEFIATPLESIIPGCPFTCTIRAEMLLLQSQLFPCSQLVSKWLCSAQFDYYYFYGNCSCPELPRLPLRKQMPCIDKRTVRELGNTEQQVNAQRNQ